VPTLKEQGVDFSLGTIRGLAVPREVPADRVRVLADAVRRAVSSEAYRASLSNAGFTPAYEDPEQFAATLRETDEHLGVLLRSEAFAGLAAKQVGPMFFPGLLFAALGGVVLGLIVAARSGGGASVTETSDPVQLGAGWRFVEPLLWIALYILVAEWIGFLLTAGSLLFVYLLRLGTRPRIAVPITLALVPAAYYLFGVLLRVGLPRGILGW